MDTKSAHLYGFAIHFGLALVLAVAILIALLVSGARIPAQALTVITGAFAMGIV